MRRLNLLSAMLATALAVGAVGDIPPALSQDSPPAPSVAQPDPIQITVSRANLQLIGNLLMELPYKTAAPILADLANQMAAADKAAAEAAK